MCGWRLERFLAVVLVHALVSCGVVVLFWVSGAGVQPLFPQEDPELWAVDALMVSVFFPLLLLRAVGLDALLPEGLPGLVTNSVLWTACVCLAWAVFRRLGHNAQRMIARGAAPHAVPWGTPGATPPSWFFAKRFATIGFLVAGLTAFSIGFREFNPPPPPPGTGLCGNCVLGGLVIMILGTSLGAVAAALAAGLLGGILDCVFPRRTHR